MKHLARRRALVATVVLLSIAPAAAAEEYRFDARSLTVGNLIGAIRVEGGAGSDFEVEVEVRGRDAARMPPRVQTSEGNEARLAIRFPVDRGSRFVYPQLGRGQTTFSVHGRSDRRDSWLRELIDAVTQPKIRVSGRGDGLEVWADVVVRVPRGGRLDVRHGVGQIDAFDVDGELFLEVRSGGVDAEGIRGELEVSTGSGGVDVANVAGRLVIDTGSGNVTLEGYDGPSVSIDTGSGGVKIRDVRTRDLEVDTGSGSVRAARVEADSATIDTGSGNVLLELAQMGTGDFEIDTGSGSITLLVPSYASAEVMADTGSGGIDVSLPDIQTLHRDRDEMRFRVGRGDAKVRLDTGSGSIRVGPVE